MTTKKKPLVFVIMSFDEKYYPIFNLIQAIAGTRGVDAERADEEKNVIKKIRPRIFSKIKDADLIIAEISAQSPNVLYEVGWAHAMGKPTLLVAEKDAVIPFDINDYLVFKYDPEMSPTSLRKQFEIEFDKYLEDALQGVNLRQPLVEMLGSIEDVTSRDDLFSFLLGWSIERFVKEVKQWTGESIHVGAAEAVEKGIKVFQSLRKGGFATYLVPLTPFWTTDDKYLQECRLAAQIRGVKIDRVFILPGHDALFSKFLQEHVSLDETAGIRTFIAFIDTIPDKDAVQDFGIWDDELLCLIEMGILSGDARVKGCMFGRDKSALDKAQLWRDTIMSVAQPAPNLLRAISVLREDKQLLLRSADLMKKESSRYCHGSYLTASNSSCEWYHSAWQYLRILDLVSTPDWHADFYAHNFKEAFEGGTQDVLISGTADYAIVYHLAKAIPEQLISKVVISVLDICETPLFVCKWYGRWYDDHSEFHLNLRHNQRDALATGYNDGTFDMITTDAFLTRFEENARKQLVREWYRVLKQGGRIITTARLSASTAAKTITTEGEVDDFVERAEKHIREKEPWLQPMLSTIRQLAHNYARNIISYPIPSVAYIQELFNGFDCSIEVGITQGEFEGTTKYARITAIKK